MAAGIRGQRLGDSGQKLGVTDNRQYNKDRCRDGLWPSAIRMENQIAMERRGDYGVSRMFR